MKVGWEYKALGECCDILDAQRKPIKKDKRVRGTIPYYGATGLLDYVMDYIFDETLVLLGEDGAKWGAGEASAYEISGKSWVNNHAHVLRPNKDEIINAWLIYYLNYANLMPYIKGVTVPKLNQQRMSSIRVPIPPLSEQQRIVSYLDSAFAKIDAVAKNAEATLNEAKALFQSALAKMMEPKEGWEEVTLDNICSIESTLVDPTDDNYNNLLHVGGANIESYTGRLINLMTAKDERLTSGKYLFDSNVVLYNKVRPYLVKVARPDFNGLCSADMYPLTPKKETTREFLYYLLIKKEFTNYAIKCSARAGMPKINRNSLFAYKASIPLNRKEQIRIVSTLDNIRKVLMHLESNLSRTLTECTALKQAILRLDDNSHL